MTFANQVHEAAAKAEKFGSKAYLASVHRQMPGISWEEFSARVVAAHQNGELELSRADLTPALNRVLLDLSEVAHENARFHFVRLP